MIFSLGHYFILDSFAQSSEESLGFSVWTITTYILGSIVILIIPTLIILLVLKRKEKLTSPTFKKILKGIGLLFLGAFVLGIAGAMSMSDEENAELERQDRLEAQRQKQIELQKQVAEQAQQRQEAQIKTSTALPDSCRGVNSMELDIYPTGKQCFAALNDRVEEWCLSQSKDCVAQFYLKLADTCEDPVLSSVEVCLMYTFKELYPKLIPK